MNIEYCPEHKSINRPQYYLYYYVTAVRIITVLQRVQPNSNERKRVYYTQTVRLYNITLCQCIYTTREWNLMKIPRPKLVAASVLYAL